MVNPAVAVVEDGRRALSSVVASQADLHAEYGGVFPEVASRQHVKVIDAVLESALKQAHIELVDVDAIAVTRGPGLPGSLVVGLNMAKGLALGSGKPLFGINHLEGHLYSAWVQLEGDEKQKEPKFPLLALIVSVQTASPLVALMSGTAAVSLLLRNWRSADLKAAWRLILSSSIGIPLGLYYLKASNESLAKAVLGALLIAFGLYNLIGPRIPALRSEKTSR